MHCKIQMTYILVAVSVLCTGLNVARCLFYVANLLMDSIQLRMAIQKAKTDCCYSLLKPSLLSIFN